MSEIVFYMIVTLAVVGCFGEHTYNGNFTCDADGNSRYVADVKKEQIAIHCGKHRAERLKKFEVDCCINEVTQSMDAFQKIFHNVVIEASKHPNLTTCTPHRNEKDNSTVSLETVKSILNEVSSTCNRYAHIMAFKHQLQCHVFNTALDSNTSARLTNLIIILQTAAIKLQKIEQANFGNSSCIEFSPEQYHHIYKSEFQGYVLHSLASMVSKWDQANDLCCQWNKYR